MNEPISTSTTTEPTPPHPAPFRSVAIPAAIASLSSAYAAKHLKDLLTLSNIAPVTRMNKLVEGVRKLRSCQIRHGGLPQLIPHVDLCSAIEQGFDHLRGAMNDSRH